MDSFLFPPVYNINEKKKMYQEVSELERLLHSKSKIIPPEVAVKCFNVLPVPTSIEKLTTALFFLFFFIFFACFAFAAYWECVPVHATLFDTIRKTNKPLMRFFMECFFRLLCCHLELWRCVYWFFFYVKVWYE